QMHGRRKVMKSNIERPADVLDRGIAAMRNNSATDDQAAAAASRVLQNLQAEHAKVVPHPAAAEAQGAGRIRGCDDFRALIPAYFSASLTPSRQLLLEDHTHECVLCRKALEEARRGPQVMTGAVVDTRRPRRLRLNLRWAGAAVVAAAAV